MVSLSDIAKEVNLNVSVVSRALNPNPDRHAVVKKETRERICEVARRMGYVPNRAASFNGKKGSATIFCFLPETADRLTADLMFGIVQAAGRENFPVNFFRGSCCEDFGKFLRAIFEREHSGLITYPPQALGGDMRRMLLQYHEKRRTVLMLNVLTNTSVQGLEQEFRDIPQLGIDEYYGGTLAAKHLIEQGCTRFYQTYLPPHPYQERLSGFCDTVRAAGFSEPEMLVSAEDFLRIPEKSADRIGIYADRDVHAFNVLIILARRNIVPGAGHVLLVGNDDKQQARYSLPTLTTVRQPTCEEGELAVKKLIGMIYGQREENQLLKPALIVRQSSGNFQDAYEMI